MCVCVSVCGTGRPCSMRHEGMQRKWKASLALCSCSQLERVAQIERAPSLRPLPFGPVRAVRERARARESVGDCWGQMGHLMCVSFGLRNSLSLYAQWAFLSPLLCRSWLLWMNSCRILSVSWQCLSINNCTVSGLQWLLSVVQHFSPDLTRHWHWHCDCKARCPLLNGHIKYVCVFFHFSFLCKHILPSPLTSLHYGSHYEIWICWLSWRQKHLNSNIL